MITLEDCEAFCDAEPALVEDVTRRERVAGIAALARAQALAEARHPVTRLAREHPARPTPAARERLAA